MKNRILSLAFLLSLVISLQSCEVVGGIFKAGYVTGIVVVLVVLALIIFLISRAFKK